MDSPPRSASVPRKKTSPPKVVTTTTTQRTSPSKMRKYDLEFEEKDEELEARLRSLSPGRQTRFLKPKSIPKKSAKPKAPPTPKLEMVSEKHRLLDQLIKRNPKYAQEIRNMIEKVDFTPKSKSGVVSSPRGLQSPSSRKSARRIERISPRLKTDLFGAKKKSQTQTRISKDLVGKVKMFYDMIKDPLVNSSELIQFYKMNLDDYSLQEEYRDYIYRNSYDRILFDKNLIEKRTQLLNFMDNELKKKISKLSQKSELLDMFGNKLV